MKPTAILDRVCGAIARLIDAGAAYDGLFPSLIDRTSNHMLVDMPPPIDGQRNCDRAHEGSNLTHDEVVLLTMYALDRPGFSEAADRYLRRFATHCTDTESGLFPWGEHAHWDLVTDQPGNSFVLHDPRTSSGLIHDHLRAVPLWLWEKLQAFNPGCVERFAEGLNNHWVETEPLEYIRHARIDLKTRHPRSDTSNDFPRHSGFYIFDWAYAFARTGRAEFLKQISSMLDYWWEKRLDDGLCLTESRTHPGHFLHQMCAVSQTLSLATSLLEAADLLDDTEPALAAEMRARAAVYTDGFLAAPHDIEQGLFILGYKQEAGGEVKKRMAIWGSVYGHTPASYTALTCLCQYRLTGDERLLGWARSVGRCYLREPFPAAVAVPAMDAGMGLGLFADLYDLTGDGMWLDGGLLRAAELVEIYCDDGMVPRGASGINWYESQMGPGFLMHGLARLALLVEVGAEVCPLAADYSGR